MNRPRRGAAVLGAAALTVGGGLPSVAQLPALMEGQEISLLRATAPEEFETWRVAILQETQAMAVLSSMAPAQFETWEAAEAGLRAAARPFFETWVAAETRLRAMTRPVQSWYLFGGPAASVDRKAWEMARTTELFALGALQEAAPVQFDAWATARAGLRGAAPEAFEAWEVLRTKEAAAADRLRAAAPDARAAAELFRATVVGTTAAARIEMAHAEDEDLIQAAVAALAQYARFAALAPAIADARAEGVQTDPEAGAVRVAVVALAAAAPAEAEAWAEAKLALFGAQARLQTAAPAAWTTFAGMDAVPTPRSDSWSAATRIAAARLRAIAPSAFEDWEAAKATESGLRTLVVLGARAEWEAFAAALEVSW